MEDDLFLLVELAAGHFEENQQKFSGNESDDVYIWHISKTYLMYKLSMQKFGVVCLFSQKVNKIKFG